MSRRKKGGGGGEDCGSWMDTYGDMVTLLLCFFVMLYSMSDINQQKWEIFVKSIFPNAGDTQQIAINENISEGEFDVSGNLEMDVDLTPESMEELFLALVQTLQENGIDGVSVSQGEGYTFVAFENQAFFNGDSSILTSEAMSSVILSRRRRRIFHRLRLWAILLRLTRISRMIREPTGCCPLHVLQRWLPIFRIRILLTRASW